MLKYWLNKLKESSISTAPIIVAILVLFILQNILLPHDNNDFIISNASLFSFLLSGVAIIVGLTVFGVGSETAMSQIGKIVGDTITLKKNLFFVICMTLLLGICVTVAEPDLAVLSNQIGVNKWIIIGSISLGVGIFLVIGVLRVLFNLDLKLLFLAFYGLVFALANIVSPSFLPLCFDSGGVTTGPVTVPFVLAFGLGIAATKKGGEDSFGFTALASVGPIICVMIISLFCEIPSEYDIDGFLSVLNNDLGSVISSSLLSSLKEVGLAIVPILCFFLIYNFAFIKLPISKLFGILIGLVYSFIGLVIFLSAVKSGFQPIAIITGRYFGYLGLNDLTITLIFAFVFGLFSVLAEPAVHVLVKQIEAISEGNISKATVLVVLALSNGLAVGLHILRTTLGFSILYYLVPGYVLAFILSFLVPKIYTAIAFDSGGVASGPMTSTFILPFAIGFAYQSLLENSEVNQASAVYEYGFGLVSLVALTPLIVLQLLGLYARIKRDVLYAKARKDMFDENENQIIHFVGVE